MKINTAILTLDSFDNSNNSNKLMYPKEEIQKAIDSMKNPTPFGEYRNNRLFKASKWSTIEATTISHIVQKLYIQSDQWLTNESTLFADIKICGTEQGIILAELLHNKVPTKFILRMAGNINNSIVNNIQIITIDAHTEFNMNPDINYEMNIFEQIEFIKPMEMTL